MLHILFVLVHSLLVQSYLRHWFWAPGNHNLCSVQEILKCILYLQSPTWLQSVYKLLMEEGWRAVMPVSQHKHSVALWWHCFITDCIHKRQGKNLNYLQLLTLHLAWSTSVIHCCVVQQCVIHAVLLIESSFLYSCDSGLIRPWETLGCTAVCCAGSPTDPNL